jgi:hypothetical protein
MHNQYIQFDKDNKFAGFNIQMLRQEPHLIDEEYTEIILKPVETAVYNEEDGTSKTVVTTEEVEETRTRKVQAKDDDGNLVFDTFEVTPLPDNAFLITPEQHDEYLTALNSQLKDVVLVKGEIKIVDKFTAEELAAQQADQAKNELMAEAQRLLDDNDYRQTKAIGGMYSDNKKETVLNYMEALREVYRQAENGVLTELPTLEI